MFSPEREDPSNPDYETRTIPKVVGGSTPACLQAGLALYRQAIDKLVPVSSTQTAEMTKLLENIHRAVNIGLANEMKIVCDSMGIDVYEVIRAAATKPFGFVPVLSRPRARRALHSDRSVLSHVESARVWRSHALHRARRRDQQLDADMGGRQGRGRAERSRQGACAAAACSCSASPTRRTSTIRASRRRSS